MTDFARSGLMRTAGFALGAWIFAAAGLLSAAEREIQNGSTVSIHYVLTVEGQVVDRSAPGQPLTYVQGMGQIVPGLERNLKGMRRGDKKQIVVEPEQAYGPVHPDAFQNVPKKSFRDSKSIRVGTIVNGTHSGRAVRATVIAVEKDQIVLDLNHPLAGKTLTFDVEIAEVKAPKN